MNKLNLKWIEPRLLEIFNNNKAADEVYTSKIFSPNTDFASIDIFNNDAQCYALFQPKFENEKYILVGGLNTKCSEARNNGTKNIQNIIEFGKTYDYDLFKLLNMSKIDFKVDGKFIDIDLTRLVIHGILNLDLKMNLQLIINRFYMNI